MRRALELAREAAAAGETPVGCVVVKDGEIVGEGRNRREERKSALSHAETEAIAAACTRLGDWRLEGCALYVTLEPCQMCSGAIIQARIDRVVMGSMNPKAGCGGSLLNILENESFNHQALVTRGILEDECSEILTKFFKELRVRNKIEKAMKRAEL